MKIWNRIKAWWNPQTLEKAVDQIARLLEDTDGDGLPDRFAELTSNVRTAVELLNFIMPNDAGIKKLAKFKALFESCTDNFAADWTIVAPIIEAAVALIKRAR